MDARPPTLAAEVEILAYPLARIPCPVCSRPAHRGAPKPDPRDDACARCNGAGVVYRSGSTVALVSGVPA